MNNKDWEEKDEFWDDEVEEDDNDDYDLGGNIDANNDETFGNAAEWNEDEHEEMIARDLIPSHSNQNNAPRTSQRDSAPINTNPSLMQRPILQPKVLTVEELERQLMTTSINLNQQQNPRSSMTGLEPSRRAGWSPFGSKDLFNNSSSNAPSGFAPRAYPRDASSFNPSPSSTQQPILQPKVLTVEELERQLMTTSINLNQQQNPRSSMTNPETSRRAGWSPFGNRELFTNGPSTVPQEQTGTVPRPAPAAAWSRPPPRVNERENNDRMMNERTRLPEQRKQRDQRRITRNNNSHNVGTESNSNYLDDETAREHHRDRRENKNHREHFRHHRKLPSIIPPQVQLGVIDKAKRMHPITAMHSDEFLQDRLPTSGDGFRFTRHSNIANVRANHDGVLTDKERDWLTRIQQKIQADYDDNIDQDYYYLMYFNRSSMTDEAAQKPTGPGVFDRRFIPRERLLYNSGV